MIRSMRLRSTSPRTWPTRHPTEASSTSPSPSSRQGHTGSSVVEQWVRFPVVAGSIPAQLQLLSTFKLVGCLV